MNRSAELAAATHCYIGVLPCGCAVAGVVDVPGWKETGRQVGKFIQEGLTIERLPLDDARARIHHCTHRVRAAETTQSSLFA